MNAEERKNLKAPVYASLALSFAILGDTFLYPFLPVNSTSVGIAVAYVGIVLSINRFVRILTNSIIVKLFGKFGMRILTIAAVVMAILSTAGYAVSVNIYFWLVFRVCWGLAYAILRISSIAYALQHTKQGFVLGFSRSIQEAGPLICLLISPLLLSYLNPTAIFILLALLSLPALYFALRLPEERDKTYTSAKSIFLKMPSSFNLLTFTSAFLIDGIVVVVLALLFLRESGDITLIKAASLAAFFLGYKRICAMIISPFGGILADRFGVEKVFNVCLLFVTMGLTLIACDFIYIGAILLFTFYGIVSALMPGNVSKGKTNAIEIVAENATWRDIGAAGGALVGGFLLSSSILPIFLAIGTLALVLIHVINFLEGKKVTNPCYYGNR